MEYGLAILGGQSGRPGVGRDDFDLIVQLAKEDVAIFQVFCIFYFLS